MNKLYVIKILIFIFALFIYSCSSTINNSNYLNNDSIEILSDISGKGDKIKNHYKITAHYIGFLEDGTEFDNSYKKNIPFEFQIGLMQVIPGWEIGLIGMQIGGKRKIKIPPSLAYGKKGIGNLVPPNSNLIFEIEIINIEPPGYIEISPKELLILKKEKILTINKIKFIIIDIRTLLEWEKTGIIEGSKTISAFDNKGNLIKNFLKIFKSNVKNNDHVIFVSNNGEISAILANGFVENLGMKNIYSLKGGINGWIKEENKIINFL